MSNKKICPKEQKYNLIASAPIGKGVSRIVKFFDKDFIEISKLIVEYTNQGYSVEVKKNWS